MGSKSEEQIGSQQRIRLSLNSPSKIQAPSQFPSDRLWFGKHILAHPGAFSAAHGKLLGLLERHPRRCENMMLRRWGNHSSLAWPFAQRQDVDVHDFCRL